MERSLINAIATAKRNMEKGFYSRNECIEDVIYEYGLRKDEVRPLIKSINKWLEGKYIMFNDCFQFSEEDIAMFENEAQ